MTNITLLLINPPFPRKVAGVPLQLLYLAAAVKYAGADVQVLDLDTEIKEKTEEILVQRLKDYQPTHVGVTAYSPSYPESLDIMRKVKEVNPSIIVISGGPHHAAMKNILPNHKFIDHIVSEPFGENALLQILGLKTRVADRTTLFPAFELLKDNPKHQFDSELFKGRRMAQILTATGCNQMCSFCSAHNIYNPFSNAIVINHLKRLIELGYNAVFFNDPNFTNSTKRGYKRIKELMDALINHGIDEKLIWGCQTKASMINPELLDLMYKGGCRYIIYAIENTDYGSLKEMRKGITPKIVQRAINWAKDRCMKTGLYVMFGTNPDREEDFEIAKDTLDYVEILQPDYISISILANYPMIDRRNTEQRIHMQLDYATNKYNREPVWLFFDEGWGAFHPFCDAQQAARYKREIESRTAAKPQIWKNIKWF